MAVTVTAQWRMKCADAGTCSLWTPATNEVKNFSYTGGLQGIVLMKAGRYKFEAWGGNGDVIVNSGHLDRAPGAYVKGEIALATASNIYVYVGQSLKTTVGNNPIYGPSFNSTRSTLYPVGGGATDFRTIVGDWDNANSLRSRIMVAAGGGGGGWRCTSGAAGGLSGYTSKCSEAIQSDLYGTGASQTAGGNGYASSYNGKFGYAVATYGIAGHGGNGWYSGESGYGIGGTDHGAGGGGSSYISGHTGSVAVTSTSSSSPKSGCTTGTTNNACSISPYGYTFTNTVMIDGAGYKWTNSKGSLQAMPNPSGGNYASGVGHSGNGYARITYLGT